MQLFAIQLSIASTELCELVIPYFSFSFPCYSFIYILVFPCHSLFFLVIPYFSLLLLISPCYFLFFLVIYSLLFSHLCKILKVVEVFALLVQPKLHLTNVAPGKKSFLLSNIEKNISQSVRLFLFLLRMLLLKKY